MSKEIKIIKEQILKTLNEMGVSVKRIVLFGSRARGDSKADSDWDFLIVLERKVSREEKSEIAHKIRRSLAEFYIPCDVIIRSEEEVEKRRETIGSVIKSAIDEGVLL